MPLLHSVDGLATDTRAEICPLVGYKIRTNSVDCDDIALKLLFQSAIGRVIQFVSTNVPKDTRNRVRKKKRKKKERKKKKVYVRDTFAYIV